MSCENITTMLSCVYVCMGVCERDHNLFNKKILASFFLKKEKKNIKVYLMLKGSHHQLILKGHHILYKYFFLKFTVQFHPALSFL